MSQEDPTGTESRYAMSILRDSHGTDSRKKTRKAQSKLPNAESLEAIEQARTGKGLVGPFNSVEELMADLNDE